jgi:hypothetical protein
MNRSLVSVAAALVVLVAVPSRARAQQGLEPVPFAQRQALSAWQDGDPVPFGYHAERKPRIALLVSGSLTFAVPYALGAATAAGSDYKELYVPVVGPFLAAAKIDSRPCSWCGARALGTAVMAAAGVVQAVGAAMLVAGAVGRQVLEADEPGSVSVAPMVLPSGGGVGVSGQF